MIENGRARLGMTVAQTFRRNTKITRMTRTSVSPIVNFTSRDSRIVSDRSRAGRGGRWPELRAELRQQVLDPSATAMVLVPGCRESQA